MTSCPKSAAGAGDAKGKRLGRPTIVVDRSRIASLRAQGRGWKAIAREMKLGVGTVLRAAQRAAKPSSENPDEPLLAN